MLDGRQLIRYADKKQNINVTRFIQTITSRFAIKPELLFLSDGIGAMLTAFFLFVIMKKFNSYFGMPQTILTYLAGIAAVFCLYSITCFFILKKHAASFLVAISVDNLLYCMLTTGLVIIYYPVLTSLGIAYFLAEIVIIFGLVFIEFKTARTIKQNRIPD